MADILDNISTDSEFDSTSLIKNGEKVEALNLNRGTKRLKKEVNHLHRLIYALMNGVDTKWSGGQSYDQDDIVEHYKRFYISKVRNNTSNPNDNSWKEIKLPIIIPEDTKVNIDLSAYIKKNVFDGVHTAGGIFEEPFLNMIEQTMISYSSTFEANAEIFRMLGASGMFSTRQYEYDRAFNPKERVFGVTYSAMGQHNHPNYRGMPGTAEFSVMANGYYVRTRHNDYRMFSPVIGGYLARKEILPPQIPAAIASRPLGVGTQTAHGTHNTQYEFMKNIYTEYPEECVYWLTYVEVWWETYSDSVGDNTESFRHKTDAANMKQVLEKALYLNSGGHKNRLENIPFSPVVVKRVTDTGVPVLATLRYRVSSHPVASLSTSAQTKTMKYTDGTTFDAQLSSLPYDEAEAIKGNSGLATNDFKLRRDLRQTMRDNKDFGNTGRDPADNIRSARATFDLSDGKLLELCERVPGMMGQGATIQESYFEYNQNDVITDWKTSSVKNASIYNHRYSMMDDDASGRRNAHRSFNDPNLLVAKTNDPKVVDGFSYMVPMELVLRTPRESWDPHGALGSAYPTNRKVTRKVNNKTMKTGSASDFALTNSYYNAYNFTIPADLYQSVTSDGTDAADTRNKAWVTTASGPKFLYAGGVNIIDYDRHRKRFAIFAEYQDYSKPGSDLEIYKKAMNAVLKKLAAGTSVTEAEIEELYK